MVAIIEIETPVWSHWPCRHLDAMVLQHDVTEYLAVGTQGRHALFAHDFAIKVHMIPWPYPRHHDHLNNVNNAFFSSAKCQVVPYVELFKFMS